MDPMTELAMIRAVGEAAIRDNTDAAEQQEDAVSSREMIGAVVIVLGAYLLAVALVAAVIVLMS